MKSYLNKPAGDTSCTALLLLKLAVATNEAEHGKMRSLCQDGLILNSVKITVKEIIIKNNLKLVIMNFKIQTISFTFFEYELKFRIREIYKENIFMNFC